MRRAEHRARRRQREHALWPLSQEGADSQLRAAPRVETRRFAADLPDSVIIAKSHGVLYLRLEFETDIDAKFSRTFRLESPAPPKAVPPPDQTGVQDN